MPRLAQPMSPFARHKRKWLDCDRCELAACRKNVVIYRGRSIPADILFVGEAPGDSEDVAGKPFIGPAGLLLEEMIKGAGIAEDAYGITNVLGCVPKEENKKLTKPPKYAIEACASRVVEILGLVKPKLVVEVGALATKTLPKIVTDYEQYATCSITHPAALLRLPIHSKSLAIQKQVVILAEAVEDLEL